MEKIHGQQNALQNITIVPFQKNTTYICPLHYTDILKQKNGLKIYMITSEINSLVQSSVNDVYHG